MAPGVMSITRVVSWSPLDFSADGWPRILSRLKTLIETGKTFKPH